MKKIYLPVFMVILFSFSIQRLKAQENDESATKANSYWQAGISYLNNSVYLGRKDPLNLPYITPSIGYYHKSGLYITGSLSYLKSASQSQVDLFELEAGYTFTSNKLDGEISASKDFYNSNSYGSLSYDFGFITPTLQAEISFNTKADYSVGLGVGHSFFAADDNLEIAPSFLLNAGTQNYYSSYYSKRKYSPKRKKANAPSGATITAYLPNAAEFKIMDYEFALPVNYTAGDFTFNFTPALAVPANSTIVVLTVKPVLGNSYTTTSTEKLSNVFYWSAGVTYKF
jgi:hypothetical protein